MISTLLNLSRFGIYSMTLIYQYSLRGNCFIIKINKSVKYAYIDVIMVVSQSTEHKKIADNIQI